MALILRTTERSIPGILEEIGRLVRLYNLSEYESMVGLDGSRSL